MQSISFFFFFFTIRFEETITRASKYHKVLPLLVDGKENGKENVKTKNGQQYNSDSIKRGIERYSRRVLPLYVVLDGSIRKYRFYSQYRPIIRLFKWMYSPWKIEKSICLSAMKAACIKISWIMCIDSLHQTIPE